MCLAIPGRIVDISSDDPLLRTGKVCFGGILKNVCLAYVPDGQVGDYVLVHVGFAISKLDVHEAERVLAALHEIGNGAQIEEASS